MRDMDRPEEVLEDEDLSISLPRRLGLSDVVGVQIRRFQEEVKRRRLQNESVVRDLIRLVIRRPDAQEIFIEAGRRVAWHAWEERSPVVQQSVRLMPRALALATALRAARRLFKQLIGPGKLTITRRPLGLRIHGSITAHADPGGSACAFYSGIFTELLQQYTGEQYRVGHLRCEARSEEVCEWTVQVSG
jgi:bacteriochlorophyll 4-vinyl reductase